MEQWKTFILQRLASQPPKKAFELLGTFIFFLDQHSNTPNSNTPLDVIYRQSHLSLTPA